MATRPEDIADIYRNSKEWSSQDVTAPKHVGDRFLPLESDAPDHTAYRKAILGLLSNKALREIEPPARTLAVDLIEGLQDGGRCDFISDFALKFPLTVFLNIMGLPAEDGVMINNWLDAYVRTNNVEEKIGVGGKIAAYVHAQVDDRIENPRNDGLTNITQGQVGDRPLTRQEIYNLAQMLTMGGIDTVAMHLSFIVIHLAQNPDKREYVRNNLDSLDRVITEYGRRYFLNNMFRTVSEDREFHGVQLKAGELIAVNAGLYNFDETLFPHPEEIDFERPAKLNLSFGAGPHACPGAALTRLEVKIFLQEWLTRIPDFEIDPDTPIALRASQMHGVSELAVRWPTKE
ncbi:cytochrome P450 [Rhodococcus pseudokoreensis]|uniref:Cytochrome P450 n=1 Tax=Rhodococcus pseudokoreensis TaxID=2811421 RepID=A0A974W4Z0_9NOCA|nr:cytochrome P450 [Rhodococcus pseudokoreensis]QSE90800.1 cytochrome P450 [Rhodococcus pseudokoreensis]